MGGTTAKKAGPGRIAPSILSADFARLGEEVAAVSAAGADLLHVDVMDGHFVPNLTIGPPVVTSLDHVTDLPLDVHLMIERPERSIESFRKAGADWISVHAEACTHLHRVVQQIRETGARAGVALNPATPLSHLDLVLADLDFVLIMSVNPGFSGQKFIPACLDKIRMMRARIDGERLSIDIEVDGGIKVDNIAEAARAGANVFVAGSSIFESADYAATLSSMRKRLAAV
ncbi:MAG: ribulose-phosphate 3-epimerase [Deltaproteobacteria bacterium RBG_13_65_10]|nr:MAG: ribulose-phosphate 3-epimerase [Deltaproteobacteria bacterium RBG_13_65_10]